MERIAIALGIISLLLIAIWWSLMDIAAIWKS
jgi:hypothetical protein